MSVTVCPHHMLLSKRSKVPSCLGRSPGDWFGNDCHRTPLQWRNRIHNCSSYRRGPRRFDKLEGLRQSYNRLRVGLGWYDYGYP